MLPNIFATRVLVYQDTKRVAETLPPPPETIKYAYRADFKPSCDKQGTVHVCRVDTIVAGVQLMREGLKPVLLNMADDRFPGGVVEQGSGAQEESIHRCTNYHKTLLHKFYPLGKREGLYSRDVSVFRTPEADGWKFLSQPYKTSFIAVPGLYFPPLDSAGHLSQTDRQVLSDKVKLILQIAAHNGHDAVVLGALGCGAWRSPASEVATVFKEVLQEWATAFTKIVFAILETDMDTYIVRNRDQTSNYTAFCDVLG